MTVSIEVVLSLFAALGIAGIIGAFFQSRFEQQKQIRQQEHELKRKRYSAILMLMVTKLDPNNKFQHLREMRPDLKNLKDLEKEIETELLNGMLFASDDVLEGMISFIRNSDHSAYVKTVIAMRRDLWGKYTKVDEQLQQLFVASELRTK